MTPRGGTTKTEPAARAGTYWQKAVRFADAARSCAEQQNWDPATANAINAIINLVDAACVHYMGQRSASGHHEDAVALLGQAADMDAEPRRRLGSHLQSALTKKNLAQYEGRLCTHGDARDALRHMERAFEAMRAVSEANGWGG